MLIIRATDKDILNILEQYDGRRAFHGDLHNHGATGGTSDGKCPLEQWKADLEKLKMDFVAILDHKQVRHMYYQKEQYLASQTERHIHWIRITHSHSMEQTG